MQGRWYQLHDDKSLLTITTSSRSWPVAHPARGGRAIFALIALMILSACTVTPPRPRPSAPPSLRYVPVVYGAEAPVFRTIARSLKQKLGSAATLYPLSRDPVQQEQQLRRIQARNPGQVVAIGLHAMGWSKALEGPQVVFCEIFDHSRAGMVTAKTKGVSLIPPPEQLFARWRALSPSLHRVLVISGPGLEKQVSAATAAAHANGVKLVHRVVRTDKEYVYAYKRAASRYQGLWLLPDNRVLSRSAILSVMTYSVRHGKQVAVFSPELLQLGGLISAQAVPDDVADQVVRRLQAGVGRNELPGPAVVDLTRSDLRINREVARQLDLVIPNGTGG
jgi:ABC-type uncharacterized transport system substrate-binding protein